MNFNEQNIKLKEEGKFDDFYKLNHKLIYYFMNKYKHNGMEKDELEQIAMITMWKCFEKWNVEKGSFITYYIYCMENEMKMAYRKATSCKAIPKQIEISLEHKLSTETEGLTYADIIEDMSSNMENAVETKIIVEEFISKLDTQLKKDIMNLFIEGYSQIDMCDIVGYSQSYINRILNRMLKKLRKELIID